MEQSCFDCIWAGTISVHNAFGILVTVIQILRIVIIYSLTYSWTYGFAEIYYLATTFSALPIPALIFGNPFEHWHGINSYIAVSDFCSDIALYIILLVGYTILIPFCMIITAFAGCFWYFDISNSSPPIKKYSRRMQEILMSNNKTEQILKIAIINYMNSASEYDEYRKFIDAEYQSNKLKTISYDSIMKYCPVKINIISYIQCFFRQNFKMKKLSKRVQFVIYFCGYILFYILPFWFFPIKLVGKQNVDIIGWQFILLCILLLLEFVVILLRFRFIFPANYARRHLFEISTWSEEKDQVTVSDVYNEIIEYICIYEYFPDKFIFNQVISFIAPETKLSQIIAKYKTNVSLLRSFHNDVECGIDEIACLFEALSDNEKDKLWNKLIATSSTVNYVKIYTLVMGLIAMTLRKKGIYNKPAIFSIKALTQKLCENIANISKENFSVFHEMLYKIDDDAYGRRSPWRHSDRQKLVKKKDESNDETNESSLEEKVSMNDININDQDQQDLVEFIERAVTIISEQDSEKDVNRSESMEQLEIIQREITTTQIDQLYEHFKNKSMKQLHDNVVEKEQQQTTDNK